LVVVLGVLAAAIGVGCFFLFRSGLRARCGRARSRYAGGMHARGAALLIVLSLLVGSLAHAAPQGETQKIEALIALVAGLDDAVFVRNGKGYDCREAAKHMRDKWKWKQDEMKSARDFIRVVASTSSQSGEPYWIQFK